MKYFIIASAFLNGLISTARAQTNAATTTYLVEIYGYENWRNAAAYSHSFAAFYRVNAQMDLTTGQTRAQSVERVDISWIPQDQYLGPGRRDLRMPAFGDWPGQNLSIEATISRAQASRRRIVKFGPYQITPQLYEAAVARVQGLRSGRYLYHGLDNLGGRRATSFNCVHAISDIMGTMDFRTGMALRGPTASRALVDYFAQNGWLYNSHQPLRNWEPLLRRAKVVGH